MTLYTLADFDIGQKVRVKPDAKFVYQRIRAAFEQAGMIGTIACIEPGIAFYPIRVELTPGLYEFFDVNELEPAVKKFDTQETLRIPPVEVSEDAAQESK